MEDVHSAGVVDYQAAEIKPTKKVLNGNNYQFYINFIIDLLKFFILSIPIYIQEIINLFVKEKEKSVAGDVALITGGGNGLGREMAIELARRGCNIAIVDVDMKAAEKTCEDLIAMQVKAKAYKVDVGNYEEVENVRDLIEKDLGPVDMLINNAGLMPKLSMREGTPKDVEKILDVNLKSHIWTNRVFLPSMIARRKGHIVCISSVGGLHAIAKAILYCTTKTAVATMMKALREELRYHGQSDFIHLTTVHPYYILTRKDVFDSIKLRFSPMTPTFAAEKIIEGILTNKFIVCLPKAAKHLTLLFNLIFPLKVQELFRDIINKEHNRIKKK